MYPFLETIRLEDGSLEKLDYHNARIKRTMAAFYPGRELILSQELAAEAPKNGLYKCRTIYDTEIRKIEFVPYSPPKIQSLKIVAADKLNYAFKFLNREKLNSLFQLRGKTDDVLLVKQGLVTDTSFCNVLFYNGKQWLTPAYPLLQGTQRQFLLEKELIHLADIRPQDLHHFTKIRLINAMIRFEDALDILPDAIYF
jgi:4-amino-4-deoxychorismate lyase